MVASRKAALNQNQSWLMDLLSKEEPREGGYQD